MANQAVRIYDHQKQPDGKWKFTPVDFEIDPANHCPDRITAIVLLLGTRLVDLD